jgi:glycosyltransferase involved in cell wall biosynthesis
MYAAAIIPVRNRPTLVVDAITSIQRQTRQLDEIIVVDDGSTDATPGVVTRLSRQDSRIRLVALAKSGGASAARNIGIGASQCEYICFLDSDDQWMPQKIELQFHALKTAPEAVASFTGIRYQRRDQNIDVSAPVHVTLENLRRRNWLGSTSTAMVRRDALRQVGGFDSSLPSCQDWDLWIKLRRIGEFSIVPQPLIVFNQMEGPRISNCKASVLAGHAQLFARALEGGLDKRERRVIAAYHQLRLTQIYLRDFREPAHATSSVMKSMMLHPTREGIALFLEACRVSVSKLLYARQR